MDKSDTWMVWDSEPFGSRTPLVFVVGPFPPLWTKKQNRTEHSHGDDVANFIFFIYTLIGTPAGLLIGDTGQGQL